MLLPLRLLSTILTLASGTALVTAQITVPLSDGQTNPTGYDTTGNPITFTIDAGTATQSGVISGSGEVIKTGTGIVNFTAVNPYSGATTISAGTLQLSATHGLPNTSGVTVESGATLELNGVIVTIDSLAGAGNILLTTGFANLFTGDADDHEFSGNISGSGGLQKYGTGTLTLNGENSIATMVAAAGTLRGDRDSLASTSLIMSAGATVVFNQATDATWAGRLWDEGTFTKLGAGNLTLTGANDSFTGTALVNAGTLTLANATGTFDNTVDVTVASGATLALGSASETIGNLNLTGGTITSSGGTLYADAFNLEAGSISAALSGKSGTSGLSKTTTDAVTLNASAAYSGSTDIRAGALVLTGTNTTLTGTSVIDVGDDATASFTISGGAAISNFGALAITLGDTSTGDGTLSLSGAPSGGYTLSGSGSVVVGNEGSGTLSLSAGASAFFSGNVRLAAGTNGVGDLTIDASNVALFGNLTIGEGTNATATTTLTNSGYINLFTGYIELASGTGSNGSLTIANGAVLAVADRVSGNGLRAGSGTATVTINGGTLSANGTLTSSLDLATSGNATFATGTNTMTLSGVISGDGTLAKTGSGTLTLSGTNTYNGGTLISGGTVSIGADAALGTAPDTVTPGHLTLNGGTLGTTETFTLAANRGISLGATGGSIHTASATTLTYGGTLTGEGAFTKSGDGHLLLTADQTHAGGTTVSAGSLTLGTGGATGSVTGDITNQGTVIFNRSGDRTYAGVVSGSGDVVHDGHILRLTAAQSYTGTTTINSGYLVLPTTVDQGLSASTHVTVGAGGTLDFSNSDLTLAGLEGAGEVYSFGGTAGNLTVNTAMGQSQTFSGTLGSTYPHFALTKAGDGTLTLSGTNTYTGATHIEGGTLALATTGTIATSTGIFLEAEGLLDLTAKTTGFTITSTQTLAGEGTISLASGQALQLEGSLTPGNSPGILTIEGDLSLGENATTLMELGGAGGVAGTDFDRIVVNGELTLGGELQIAFVNGFLPSPGQSFQLFVADSISGAFGNYTLPMISGALWDTSTLLSNGTLGVTAVPEPSALALLLGLVALGAVGRHRRKIRG